MTYSYLLWLLLFVWLPTLLIWVGNFHLFWKYKHTILCTVVLTLLFSIPWDIYAIKSGIWYFPKPSVVGIFFLSIPLEEYLFMATVALLISSVTILVKYKFNKSKNI